MNHYNWIASWLTFYLLLGDAFIMMCGWFHRPPFSGFKRWWQLPICLLCWPLLFVFWCYIVIESFIRSLRQ